MDTLLNKIGLPASLATLFTCCTAFGLWLDSEADDDWKQNYSAALRSGVWYNYLQAAYIFMGRLLDRVLGKTYFNRRMIAASFIISLTATAALSSAIVLTAMGSHVYDIRLFLAELYSLFAEERIALIILIPRVTISFFIDYATLVRVKYFCRRVFSGKPLFWELLKGAACDLLTLIVCCYSQFLLVDGLTLVFDRPDAPVLSVDVGMLHRLWIYFSRPFIEFGSVMIGKSDLFGVSEVMVESAALGLVPAAFFYLYTLAIVAIKILSGILRPLVQISAHLKFTKPFTVISNVSGLILVLLIWGVETVWRHV